ncbi:ADP-ribosylglycohydrolase family protein [Tautonia sociabilis]|uniref:ADP-ribosylglycohydrolase n=1 Tax=Tautonia sociabilis TaxID=2080755 RepID=A0A432MHF9_9BACT|nr:ADP-ribosylglycohydrolase family protein [Tautonia sociabilis]RUL86212.1 ADP-ribosylglycohydrolase [Tautonia sociabilis]
MPLSTNLDRVRGTLLGLAVGDALGAPLEGLSPQQIRAHYGTVVDYVDGVRAWKRKPYRWRLPGLYTDDTQQALALCDVILRCGTVDPDCLAALYLALATPRNGHAGAHRGVGRSFRQVLEELERGRPPLECGQDSAGIGAAMRIAPVAIAFFNDTDGLFEAVMAASLMTHRDIRSLAGAMAVVSAVRRLLGGEEKSPSLLFRVAGDVALAERRIAECLAHAVDSIPEYGRSLSRAIANVEPLLELSRADAHHALIDEANAHGARPSCKRPTMGFPPACIPTCLYVLLTTDTFEEALTEVVNLGGDADSAGAILGAMAGAHFGVDAIPERWLEGLHNRVGIERRAEALAVGPDAVLEIPDLVETERALSALEHSSRESFKAPPSPNAGSQFTPRTD